MGLGEALRGWLGGAPSIRVHVMIRGRVGEGWVDVDEAVRLPLGATIRDLVVEADRRRIPLREAIEHSPHLAHTFMLNGERCPVDENGDRALVDGDQVYLLAPLAGG